MPTPYVTQYVVCFGVLNSDQVSNMGYTRTVNRPKQMLHFVISFRYRNKLRPGKGPDVRAGNAMPGGSLEDARHALATPWRYRRLPMPC